MPKGFQENTGEWIRERYGQLNVASHTVYVATCPVMNGVAQGIGVSEAKAIEALYLDLTCPPAMETAGAILTEEQKAKLLGSLGTGD